MSIPFQVTFLGTGAVHPTARRGTTASLVVRGGDKWLVDCGEGTQAKLWAATGGLPDLDGVFLTHYHGDHVLGLLGMVETMALWGRTRPLSIYGPPKMADHLSLHYQMLSKHAKKLIRWCDTAPDTLAARMDDYEVRSFQTYHAGGIAQGYVFAEHDRPGRIDAGMCKAAGLTGPEIGRVKGGFEVKGIRPEDVVGPTQRGRKVVITGDTAYSEYTVKVALDADLLVHEATYLARTWRPSDHTTARDAARIGAAARVRRLALTHIAARHTNREIREEAETQFPGALVPHDLDSVTL